MTGHCETAEQEERKKTDMSCSIAGSICEWQTAEQWGSVWTTCTNNSVPTNTRQLCKKNGACYLTAKATLSQGCTMGRFVAPDQCNSESDQTVIYGANLCENAGKFSPASREEKHCFDHFLPRQMICSGGGATAERTVLHSKAQKICAIQDTHTPIGLFIDVMSIACVSSAWRLWAAVPVAHDLPLAPDTWIAIAVLILAAADSLLRQATMLNCWQPCRLCAVQPVSNSLEAHRRPLRAGTGLR